MLTVSRLGGLEEDVTSILGPLVGQARVSRFIRSLETKIRTEAEAGARQAIPDIRAEVKTTAESTIKPYVLVALGLGATAVAVSGYVWYRGRRRR